ncbi:hypothetical protein [Tissierella sp. P1]|uniref:hypothetical protein n=1 Tax=Tissierella sp. P1 TaxID=1280483 RepID=UPI00117C826B|nr:hypothetical protein [Tissierella sp. P1]
MKNIARKRYLPCWDMTIGSFSMISRDIKLLELKFMGSRIIHYCVGNKILKRVKLDEHQFMLGNLAPDAYSPELGGYLVSHFRIPEEIMKFECVDLERFKSKYKHQITNDFVLGYYCHLITDNLWLKDAYKKYGHLGLDERNQAVKLVYKGYWVLNTKLMDKFSLNLVNF